MLVPSDKEMDALPSCLLISSATSLSELYSRSLSNVMVNVLLPYSNESWLARQIADVNLTLQVYGIISLNATLIGNAIESIKADGLCFRQIFYFADLNITGRTAGSRNHARILPRDVIMLGWKNAELIRLVDEVYEVYLLEICTELIADAAIGLLLPQENLLPLLLRIDFCFDARNHSFNHRFGIHTACKATDNIARTTSVNAGRTATATHITDCHINRSFQKTVIRL